MKAMYAENWYVLCFLMTRAIVKMQSTHDLPFLKPSWMSSLLHYVVSSCKNRCILYRLFFWTWGLSLPSADLCDYDQHSLIKFNKRLCSKTPSAASAHALVNTAALVARGSQRILRWPSMHSPTLDHRFLFVETKMFPQRVLTLH